MSDQQFVWNKDDFDAVSIWVPGGKCAIEAIDGDQVLLEGELVNRLAGIYTPEPKDRWLQVHLGERTASNTPFTLKLPKDKVWVVDFYAWMGQVEVTGLHGRLHGKLQKGDFQVSDCQGTLYLSASDGNVELRRCVEEMLPEPPPLPQWQYGSPTDLPVEKMIPPMPSGPFFEWRDEEWTAWGIMFGEKARAWGEGLERFFDPAGMKSYRKGISVRASKGNATLSDVEADTCVVRLSHGNASLERGWIGALDLHSAMGNLECKGIYPRGDWKIKTNHGNIKVSIPQDASARINAATRSGEIRSEIPLVRVGRPGPEARNGGRMVGSIGNTPGTAPEIELVCLHGDVNVELRASTGRPPEPQATQWTEAPEVIVTPPPSPFSIPVEPVAPPESGATPAGHPTADPQLAILQALSEGKITVAEAEKLLDSLPSA